MYCSTIYNVHGRGLKCMKNKVKVFGFEARDCGSRRPLKQITPKKKDKIVRNKF